MLRASSRQIKMVLLFVADAVLATVTFAGNTNTRPRSGSSLIYIGCGCCGGNGRGGNQRMGASDLLKIPGRVTSIANKPLN
jgi:hypothetical protein